MVQSFRGFMSAFQTHGLVVESLEMRIFMEAA